MLRLPRLRRAAADDPLAIHGAVFYGNACKAIFGLPQAMGSILAEKTHKRRPIKARKALGCVQAKGDKLDGRKP